MIKVFRDGDSCGFNPFAEKLGVTRASSTGKTRFQTLGSIWIRFQIFAGKGSSVLRANIDAESFPEVAAAMVEANEDAAIRAFGSALESHQDPTIQACGQILSDQRKPVETTAAPQTVAA
jgi:hypothetical protein